MDTKIINFEGILNNIKIRKSVNIFVRNNNELKSNINIRYSYKKDNKTIECLYIIPKIDLKNIIKNNNNNNFNFINNDYVLDIIKKILYIINEENNNSYSFFADYLMSIDYFEDEKLMFTEIFFSSDNYYLSQISEIYEGEKIKGYGFIIKESGTHFHFIKQKEDNILDSLIYKDYNIVSNKEKNVFNNIDAQIEKYFKEFFLTIPNYKIKGIFSYTEIKIICMNYFNKFPLKINLIKDYPEILNTCENKIIFILRYKNHISILLKIDNDFISFDTSFKHLKEYKIEINKNKNNNLISFKKELQNTGCCSFYSIKILELISKMDVKNIKENFSKGNFLLDLIKEMAGFFSINNNKVLFSDTKEKLNSWNEKLIIIHNNSNNKNNNFYIDDNFHINKFVIIKNFLINLNKNISKEFDNLIQNQKIVYLLNLSLRKNTILENNYDLFKDFYNKINENDAISNIDNMICELKKDKDIDINYQILEIKCSKMYF